MTTTIHRASPMVYFMEGKKSGAIKIGYSRDPQARQKTLQSSNHEEIGVITFIAGDRHMERLLHDAFRDERIRGEWFRPSPRLMRFINLCESVELWPSRAGYRQVRRLAYSLANNYSRHGRGASKTD